MDIYKIGVEVNGRELLIHARSGMVASVEIGTKSGNDTKKEEKVVVFIGDAAAGKAAWVQVLKFQTNDTFSVVHEGWVHEGTNGLQANSGIQLAKASLSKVVSPDPKMLAKQSNLMFGKLACCTAACTNGKTITCCNSCCSDPVGCPGGSCCA